MTEAVELNIDQILQYLPHRYPFLLVDRVTVDPVGKTAIGYKNVTINEPFFQGHFPDHPIMPGVLIIEGMAQVGGVYSLVADQLGAGKLTYFTGIDNAKFRRPVRPGDVLRMELTMDNYRRGIYVFSGKGYVGDTLVAEATLKATFVDR